MLSKDYLNVRGHVSVNGVRGANRRCDCDGYRSDTLGGGIGRSVSGSAVWKSAKCLLQSLRTQVPISTFVYFKCLGIRRTASDEEVKHKNRALMSARHPDKFSATGSASASIAPAKSESNRVDLV